ncbi:MAG: lamin tail domain-containing protein, partial [Akkermansiaceae bacterium]
FQTANEASDAQRFLRITEMLFAPVQGKEFEFIELRNLGPNPLDLSGIQFTDGIEAALTGTLAPGEFGLVVANPDIFPGQRILGTYTGALNNGGEQVTLRDAAGENILSFDYDGNWFSPSRQSGYSLVIRDESADWFAWDDQFQWAISSEPGGSPGNANPVPFSNDYASWIRDFFTAEELDDPMISSPAADASGNSLSNLMHYAFGLDPKATVVPAPSRIVVDGDSVFLNLTRLERTPDLRFEVEVSTDLVNWDLTAPMVAAVSQGNGTEAVSFQSPLPLSGQNQQYLRIRLIRNP